MSNTQKTTGEPGSPSATTTLRGEQLLPPDPGFDGVIKERVSESKAWWPPRVVPPKGARNVVLTLGMPNSAPRTYGNPTIKKVL
jgi:hypothetical protein